MSAKRRKPYPWYKCEKCGAVPGDPCKDRSGRAKKCCEGRDKSQLLLEAMRGKAAAEPMPRLNYAALFAPWDEEGQDN